MNLRKIFRIIISLPKTVYFNFRTLPFKQALLMPIFVAYDVELGGLSKVVCLDTAQISPFMIKFCLGGSQGVIARGGYFSCKKESKIVFKGKASFGVGSSIRVDGGVLIFGKNFSANKNCFFSCSKKIVFGADVLLGFNNSIRDSDGHAIYCEGKEKENLADVEIGNHVWITSNVDILKGVTIGNESVVAYRSCVVNKLPEEKCLIGGYPAKVIQRDISWKK